MDKQYKRKNVLLCLTHTRFYTFVHKLSLEEEEEEKFFLQIFYVPCKSVCHTCESLKLFWEVVLWRELYMRYISSWTHRNFMMPCSTCWTDQFSLRLIPVCLNSRVVVVLSGVQGHQVLSVTSSIMFC